MDDSSGHREQLEGQLDFARHYEGRLVTRCHSLQAIGRFTRGALRLYCRTSRAKRGGVDTPPGLSTAILGDSFEDLSQKRAGVDMWTVFSLLIIKGIDVHISWGSLGVSLGGPLGDRFSVTPPPNLGEPFRCPRWACLMYALMEVVQAAVGVDRALV